MKIIKVTSGQFYEIWSKLLPSNRIEKDIPTPNIFLSHVDTLLVLENSVKFISMPDLNGNPISLAKIFSVCAEADIKEVTNG